MNNYAIVFSTISGSIVRFQARARSADRALAQAGNIDGWEILALAETDTADTAADYLAGWVAS